MFRTRRSGSPSPRRGSSPRPVVPTSRSMLQRCSIPRCRCSRRPIIPRSVSGPAAVRKCGWGRGLSVGACNQSSACSQTAWFPAHVTCQWRGASCSNYLPVCSPSSGAACKRGVVLTLLANGFSKPVAGRRFCEADFHNSSDKQRSAEMRGGHGPPARSSERKVFANSGRRIERAQIYVYDRTSRTALASIVPFGMVKRE